MSGRNATETDEEGPMEGPANPFNIDRTIFNKEDQRTQDLHLQLSEKYMVYKDYADRAIINPAQIDKGDHRVFYIKPESVFMKEPNVQNKYRNEFIRQVAAPPIPEPMSLLADDIMKNMLEEISDQSAPHKVRERFTKFFKRRQYKLQHKKHVFLARWAHFAMTSELVDKVSLKFSPYFAKVQFELEQAVKRHQRLDGEDHFDSGPRPQRLEPNGEINPEDVDAEGRARKYCSLRIDDVEIYSRIVGYESNCNKLVEKFVNRAKWIPMTHRYDIYIQAQERLHVLQDRAVKEQLEWQQRVQKKGNYLIELQKLGERGFKQHSMILAQLPQVRAERRKKSVRDRYIQTTSYNYEYPPLLIVDQIDLKLRLEDLIRQNSGGIKADDMEVDDGNSFSYAIVIKFQQLFNEQVVKSQFAPYDPRPIMLNPAEIGRQDIYEVIKENQIKYGRQPAGSTLLEQVEIEKQSERFNIQYINQVEKALFGTFNNGQLPDFPKVRLKECTWLPYICFKAELREEQMAQAAMLSSESNPIDQVSVYILELLNTNDYQSVNLTLESLSQIHADKAREGKVRPELAKLDRIEEKENIFSDQQRIFLQTFQQTIKVKSNFGFHKDTQEPEEHVKDSLFDTKQNLLFSQYLMVSINSREQKIKLLYTLNAFRSIQKRVALELRELTTRDRVNFDSQNIPPGELASSLFTEEAADKEILQQKKERIDAGKKGEERLNVEHVIIDELIDIKKFRYKGLTQNQMWSTNPVLPKFHATYGQPIERQEVSSEFEVTRGQDPRQEQASRRIGNIDFIKVHEPSGLVMVRDDYGINLMYDCTFADMQAIEQEMLRTVSYFINKLEPFLELGASHILPLIDRFNFMREMLICEERYQKCKLNLVFAYLECYEHMSDTLEQQQLIQVIVDLMARRPRINFEANHFKDSYDIECKLLETSTSLVKEFIKMQIDNELKCNNLVKESLEKTYRLIYDQIDNKWQYFDKSDIGPEKQKRELNAVGVKSEKDIQRMKDLEYTKPGMFQAKQPTVSVAQFAEMVGIPLASLQMLLKDHHERDPLVKQSIHENTSFIKLQEGYPLFFSETEYSKQNKVTLVPDGHQIGILEVFDSLSQVVRVAAASHHACREMAEVHKPDNGLISALYELVTTEFLLAELRAVRSESRGDQIVASRDMDLIEDSSILGNSEKMLFFIKELIAGAEDPELIQNPFVMTKLDLQTLKEFDFDAVQGKKFQKKNGILSPQAEARQAQRQIEKNLADDEEGDLRVVQALEHIVKNQDEDSMSDYEETGGAQADDFVKRQRMHERMKDKNQVRLVQKYTRPNIPPMLEICCNCVEALRLRHTLVEAYHQRFILEKVYQVQCKALGKDSKLFFKDAINFQTHLSGGLYWKNFVDQGPGQTTSVETELAIKEFDATMTSVMNFADPEAFKALVCPMGLEELRIVVRYELLNLHLLIVGVRHNQILLDSSQRRLAEIELFEKGWLVSAPAHDLLDKLKGSNLYDQNLKRFPVEERRLILQKLHENVAKISYNIFAKKSRPKEHVENQYKKIRQVIIDHGFEKVELGLRYLRTSRLMLCHDFCEDIQSQLFIDSVKLELLNEVNQIRQRAYLLPRNSMILNIPVPVYGEHFLAAYNEHKYRVADPDDRVFHSEPDFYDIVAGKILEFNRLPSFSECCIIRADLEDFQKTNLPRILYSYHYQPDQAPASPDLTNLFDENQKALVKKFVPLFNQLDLSNSESMIAEKGRFCDYKQAPVIQEHLVFKYLLYFRNLQNLYDLEYFRSKLKSRSASIMRLEQAVMSGLPFWEEQQTDPTQEDEEPTVPEESEQEPEPVEDIKLKNVLAEKVARNMADEKRRKLSLMTELEAIKDVFNMLFQRMNRYELHRDIKWAADFIQEQLHITYYSVLLGIQSVKSSFATKGEAQKEIHLLGDILKLFSHIDESKVVFNNGYHVNSSVTSTGRISLEHTVQRPDYVNFFQATTPIMDEEYLNPAEFNLIRGMFTPQSIQLRAYRRLKPYLGWIPKRDFSFLDNKLINLHQQCRRIIQSRIKEYQDTSLDYAHAKFKIEPKMYLHNTNTQMDVFAAQKEYIKQQIKSHRLKTALMMLLVRDTLPTEAAKLKRLHQEFTDLFSWKVMSKAYEIERYKLQQAQAKADRLHQIQKSIAQQNYGYTEPKKEQVDPLLTQYDLYSTEVDVYQTEIQNYMILTSIRHLDRETSALTNAFEINGKRLEVLVNVHQQFAATMDDQDKLNHLDIIKLTPLQKFLSQIKNRMLTIKTLTGGEGVVIRLKDLLTILDDLARGIIKHGEIEMRTRAEQFYAQISCYQQLLYGKDQQIYMLEHKLRHAADQLNKVVNIKVFSKGNQMIYESDHAARQLRMIKDNVFQMEHQLRQEIKIQFAKDLDQARMQTEEQKKKFGEYKATLNSHMTADIKRNINELDEDIKLLVKQAANPVEFPRKVKTRQELLDEYAHFMQGKAKDDYKEAKKTDAGFAAGSVLNNEDLIDLLREFERLKASEKEARDQVLEMQHLMRKQRIIQNFKWLQAHQQWDLKEQNLRQQMTSNATLWEQLAESEKREQVLKMELQRSQEQVASLERVMERLKEEVAHERQERTKLLNYKESTIKRVSQMENQSKQADILQNIDLDKILGQISQKDRKMEKMQAEAKEGSEVIQSIYRNTQKELAKSRKKIVEETRVKEQAFQKMDQLRSEIQLLQSGDIGSIPRWKERVSRLKEEKELIAVDHFTPSRHMQKSTLTSVDSYGLLNQASSLTPIMNRKVASQVKVLPQLQPRGSLPGVRSTKKPKTNIFQQLVNEQPEPRQGLFNERSSSVLLSQQHTILSESNADLPKGVDLQENMFVGIVGLAQPTKRNNLGVIGKTGASQSTLTWQTSNYV